MRMLLVVQVGAGGGVGVGAGVGHMQLKRTGMAGDIQDKLS